MDVDIELSARLSTAASISNQRDRINAYLALLSSLLTAPLAGDELTSFGRHFTTSTSMAMVVGRRVLGAFVTALSSGLEVPAPADDGEDETEERARWTEAGKVFTTSEENEEIRRTVIEQVLQPELAGWCEEQTTTLRHAHAAILMANDDWLGAARALMKIPLDGGSRLVSDEEKLAVYMKIVRLLLECGESGLAQTYFSRASLLIHNSNDQVLLLTYRLSQARLFDHSARFVEAAQKYHEVSFNTAIDEEDRLKMLAAAVTTSILAPAGPQRSRVLAALNRDDRVHTSLKTHLSSMLRKMLLDRIVRADEVHEFERGLEEHQRATVAGGGTMLERAVREHNVGACAKIYDNVGFERLGDLLGLDAANAEATARRMIEQGRLRAWIDQPLSLLFFESRHEEDDQGTAGGLGIERVEKPVEPVSWTERWDQRIRDTSVKVESLAETIISRGLIPA